MYKYKYMPLLMWLFPLLFFSDQFILRLWPGLMMHQIMEQFSIDATSFGFMAACYYYGYAGMQIPIAILLDRFGAQLIVFLFAVICGLATILFTYSDNFALAVLSRFLIGAGSAVGFLGTSKVISEWFPKDNYAKMIGFSFTFGLMGAIYGGKPVSLLIETYSWQTVALGLGLIAILIGCASFLILRSPKVEPQSEVLKLRDFRSLFSSKWIWFLALANLLMVGSLEGFADVWGVPYLMTAYHLPKSDAAGIVSFIFYGMLIGGPLLAYAAKRIGTYPVIAFCGFGMALAFIALFMNPLYNWWLIAGLLFSVGVLCCYQVIIFAAGAEFVSSQYLGVTVAFLNCINMLGGSFFHTLIGKIMDLYWTGAMTDTDIRYYNLDVYKYGLSIIPICAVLGAAIICFLGFRSRQFQLDVD